MDKQACPVGPGISVEMLPGFESIPGDDQRHKGRSLVRKVHCRSRLRGLGRKRKLDPRRVLAVAMEVEVQNRLVDLGYIVTGTRHKAHFDLLVHGVRVEVKASTWGGRRYQFNLRDSRFDVLVLGCLGDDLAFFVIPANQVRGLSYVKITSRDPGDYQGRFAPFLEAWDVVDQMILAGVNAWQLPLFRGLQ